MSRAVRHLFACLLLVLLPFQALAASYAMADAPLVSCADMMLAGMDCCDDDSGTCPDASHCTVHFAAIALPVAASASPALPGNRAGLASVPALHDSFIPDRLQRPPQASL